MSLGLMKCPVGCGRALPDGKVMCKPCWGKVPEHLQKKVYAAWRKLCRDMTPENVAAHRQAKEEAIGAVS